MLKLPARVGIILALILAAGCAVRVNQYYVPSDPAYLQEGKVCGGVPWGGILIRLTPGTAMAISILPQNGAIGMSVQVPVGRGDVVRFLSPEFVLSDPDGKSRYSARLDTFRRAMHSEYVNADAYLRGQNDQSSDLKKSLYISSARFLAGGGEAWVLTVPALEVNGSVLPARDLRLRLVAKSGVMTCIQ